jgi:hypothetical protein
MVISGPGVPLRAVSSTAIIVGIPGCHSGLPNIPRHLAPTGGWCILAARSPSRREVPAATFMKLRSNRADGVADLIAGPFPAD